MEKQGIVTFPRPAYGRIPNFKGNKAAAEQLTDLDVWKKADVVKVNPDAPQYPVRVKALKEGKMLYMPSPRLRQGFLELSPAKISRGVLERAATIKGAFRFGRKTSLGQMEEVDFVVAGSVAVDLEGGRVGKAGGYSDLEFGILREVGLIQSNIKVATTVHEVQVVEKVPMTEHDVSIDYVATPQRLIETETHYPKPKGVYWELVDDEMLEKMPVLKVLQETL